MRKISLNVIAEKDIYLNVMENKELKKHVIMLLLLNKNNAFSSAYPLIRALSVWFNIIDFNDLAQEMIEEGLLIRQYTDQVGYYNLTNKAVAGFQLNQVVFEKEVKLFYAGQREVIEGLLRNLR